MEVILSKVLKFWREDKESKAIIFLFSLIVVILLLIGREWWVKMHPEKVIIGKWKLKEEWNGLKKQWVKPKNSNTFTCEFLPNGSVVQFSNYSKGEKEIVCRWEVGADENIYLLSLDEKIEKIIGEIFVINSNTLELHLYQKYGRFEDEIREITLRLNRVS